jgi:hypothetical protein
MTWRATHVRPYAEVRAALAAAAAAKIAGMLSARGGRLSSGSGGSGGKAELLLTPLSFHCFCANPAHTGMVS